MSLIEEYIAHGWSVTPIRPGSKRPYRTNWETQTNALVSASDLPDGDGIGLMHAYSGTMALDVDDWDRTKARGIDLDALFNAPDAVQIISGKEGRGKLLYKMPFGIKLPTKKFQDEIGRDENNRVVRINVFELRCATLEGTTVQDVLPPSIHPETGRAYAWGGTRHWTRLPWLPASILQLWQDSLKDIRPPSSDGVDSSWDEIKEALGYIDASCPRDEWIRVGMALQWVGEQTWNQDQAFQIWNQWSSKSLSKYNPREMQGQWNSFRTTKSVTVTLGTLFKYARSYGWPGRRVDASSMFSTTMVKPEDIISTMKPQPPDIDLDLWPKALVKRAEEVSQIVGCDPLVPLWSGLAAVCGVIDARTRLELAPGFKVPPVLWLMTVGDPGDRKSPGSRPMIEPVTDVEASDRQRFARDKQDWEYKHAVWARSKKAVLEYAQSSEGLLDQSGAPQHPGEEPVEPVPLKITVSDITSQALLRSASKRPRGLLCYLDEMNSWAYKVCNGATGENRSTWVVAYEATRYEMDRVMDGSHHCDNLAVSMYGNMQPQVLNEYFDRLASDGLLQRFLPCVLRHDKTRLPQPIPDILTSAGEWERLLHQTYALTQTTYRLSPEAYQIFYSFQEWYEERMRSERLIKSSHEFITAFGKITGLAGRLILLFHAIEAPFAQTVSADIVMRVIRIVREFIIPTYRYVFDNSGMSLFDMWVTEYIIQHADKERITMSEIKRSAVRQWPKVGNPSPFMQNEYIISAMYVLEKMGWTKRSDNGTQEGKGIAEWLINPYLKTTFADYRRAVVQAKVERDNDRLSKAGIDRPTEVHGADVLD